MKYTKNNIIGIIFEERSGSHYKISTSEIKGNVFLTQVKKGTYKTEYVLENVLSMLNSKDWKVIKEAELQYEIY